MSKVIKIISLISLISFSCLLAYNFSYFIAEKYFFDKFFFNKDVNHGYRKYDNPPVPLSSFGERVKDIIALESNNPNILGVKDDSTFKIAVIGDSYVWGLGIRNDQRFPVILEKKLNRIRPTKIISIGDMGNQTLDYLKRYDQLQKNNKTDLNIFALVGNDAFINERYSDYLNITNNCVNKFPKIQPEYEIYDKLYTEKHGDFDINDPYIQNIIDQAHINSWTNPINLCVVRETSRLLPTDNAIYFVTDNYTHDNSVYTTYTQILKETNKYVLSSELGETINKYKQYWLGNPHVNFAVSNSEGHPNALANQMYADILFNEITTSPKWGFTK